MGSVLWTLWTLLALTTGTVRSEKEEPETTSKPEQHRSSFECPFSVSPHQVDSSSAAEAAGVADDATADDDLAWCLPKGYNKQRPDFASRNEHSSMNLTFRFGILEVTEIDDIGQSLSVPMYLSVSWPERRLWINRTYYAWKDNITGPVNSVTEDPKSLEKEIWIPDLEIYGLEEYISGKVIKPMAGIRIWKNKTIEYNARVVVKISCRMDFDNYPFDKHICRFRVGSYFYREDVISCQSSYSDPTQRRKHGQRNLQHNVSFVPLLPNETRISLESGEYAICGFRVILERKQHQLIFQVYLPCILFVSVSWVSFLIKPEVVPGRMALLVTIFLVLVNIFNTARSDAPIPTGSTLNAIDTYLVTSIVMVFFALLEYAIILFAMHYADSADVEDKKRWLKRRLEAQLSENKVGMGDDDHNGAAEQQGGVDQRKKKMFVSTAEGSDGGGDGGDARVLQLVDSINASLMAAHPRKALLKQDAYKVGAVSIRKVDVAALILLPVTFAIFNIYYWVWMANADVDFPDPD